VGHDRRRLLSGSSTNDFWRPLPLARRLIERAYIDWIVKEPIDPFNVSNESINIYSDTARVCDLTTRTPTNQIQLYMDRG